MLTEDWQFSHISKILFYSFFTVTMEWTAKVSFHDKWSRILMQDNWNSSNFASYSNNTANKLQVLK